MSVVYVEHVDSLQQVFSCVLRVRYLRIHRTLNFNWSNLAAISGVSYQWGVIVELWDIFVENQPTPPVYHTCGGNLGNRYATNGVRREIIRGPVIQLWLQSRW